MKGQFAVETENIELRTEGQEIDLIDLSSRIRQFITTSGIREGRFTVFVPGSTGAIIATEFEPRLIQDTKRVIKQLIRKGDGYEHDKIDNNAHAHLRTTLLGSEMTIPVIDGCPTLGTWQQVCFADFDTRPRRRTLIFQIMGVVSE